MKLYEPYVETESEKFASDTISQIALVNAKEEAEKEFYGLSQEPTIIPVKINKGVEFDGRDQFNLVHGIVASIAYEAGEDILLITNGPNFTLSVVLDQTKPQWKELRSPTLVRSKLAPLTPYHLAGVFHSLNEDRDVWKLTKTHDASQFFPEL